MQPRRGRRPLPFTHYVLDAFTGERLFAFGP
jgi:hypothetical protein